MTSTWRLTTARHRVGSVLASIGLAIAVASCTVTQGFPDRIDAGVLTTGNGTMHLVLTPCARMTVDEIALMYTPSGASPESQGSDQVVVRYRADAPMFPASVFPPVVPDEVPEGWTLTAYDEALLSAALDSTRSSTFEDRFFVEVLGHLADGSPERLGGSWSADVSRPDTVVLGSEVLDDPLERKCQDNGGWTIAA